MACGGHYGLAHWTPHDLRRFAAKRWVETGLNIRRVQLLPGHEDLHTTIRYLNYDRDERQRAAAQVSFGITVKPLLDS